MKINHKLKTYTVFTNLITISPSNSKITRDKLESQEFLRDKEL